jgi:hypothetical protein
LGTQLIPELVAEGLHAVTSNQPRLDKVMRMAADRDHRERFCAFAQGGGEAPRILARADGIP